MYYQPELETMSREELEKLQLNRLKDLVKRVYEKIPFYKESFDAAGVKPEDIRSLNDITKLPFTIKQDLRDAYPFKMFAVPQSEVVRIHCLQALPVPQRLLVIPSMTLRFGVIVLRVSCMRQIVIKTQLSKLLTDTVCLPVA